MLVTYLPNSTVRNPQKNVQAVWFLSLKIKHLDKTNNHSSISDDGSKGKFNMPPCSYEAFFKRESLTPFSYFFAKKAIGLPIPCHLPLCLNGYSSKSSSLDITYPIN